jgi:hypothetical protein
MSTQRTGSGKKASSSSLNRQIGLYSLAACAAGVSVLALATPSTAEVVVTRAHLPVGGGVGITLDMNHDGVADFAMSIFSYQDFSPNFRATFNLSPVGGGAVVASPGNVNFYASALARGAKIGPSARFSTNGLAVVERSYGDCVSGHATRRTLRGNWGNDPQNRYLGVKFLIDGETHYGWIRMTLTSKANHCFSLRGTITAYAYEAEANTPIYAGLTHDPTAELQAPENVPNQAGPSLGMLAAGAEAVPLWRREENLASK